MGGDFRQILPVLKNKGRAAIVHAAVLFSHLWEKLEIFNLTTNLRLENDPDGNCYRDFCLRVGEGKEPTNDNQGRIPESLRFKGDLSQLIMTVV